MKGTLRKTDDSWVVEYKFEKDLFSSEGGQIPIYRDISFFKRTYFCLSNN